MNLIAPSRWLLLLALALSIAAGSVQAGEMAVQAQLIWGSEAPVKDTKHPLVDSALTEKLKKVFKWKYYYEVKNQKLVAPSDKPKRYEMSEKCHIELQAFGKSEVEVKLFGEGKHLRTVRQPIPKGETLVLAGDDKNDTVWCVVLTN